VNGERCGTEGSPSQPLLVRAEQATSRACQALALGEFLRVRILPLSMRLACGSSDGMFMATHPAAS
jgi:hypothetical protein